MIGLSRNPGLYREACTAVSAERQEADGKVGQNLERETGIEPATSSLGSWRSTAELLPPEGLHDFSSRGESRKRKVSRESLVSPQICNIYQIIVTLPNNCEEPTAGRGISNLASRGGQRLSFYHVRLVCK